MKSSFDLNRDKPNYGWAFDGVPEENSVCYEVKHDTFEIPAIILAQEIPEQLLGRRIQEKFGNEFPIRFDYLDTMEGENLSLQVHPKIDFIRDNFGMTYTQNESYYILRRGKGAVVYLGVKDGVSKTELFDDLDRAQKKEVVFDDKKYINRFQVEKHDHYSIPAGLIHCGGKDTVILEISQTPYIFTFKLWDWGRTGLDGQPRPIHLKFGYDNVDINYNRSWIKKNLLNITKTISDKPDHIEEQTGLYETEAIETRRHWFSHSIIIETHHSVNMLNLVEGDRIRIESLNDKFEPQYFNFGETFIIPEQISRCLVTNVDTGHNVALIQAYIRN